MTEQRESAGQAILTLEANGWRRSLEPNTYVPKPISVWVRDWDGLHALVHCGRVDVSGDMEIVLGSDVLRALADLADAPVEDTDPVETTTPVRMLIWYACPGMECLAWDGDIAWAVRWCSPTDLLTFVPECSGLWVWEGTASAVASGRASEPDTISLHGSWRRPTDAEALDLASGSAVFTMVSK